MQKVVAVSGGVDSMTLFELLKDEKIIVAHFNHGTRESAREDAKFVIRKAEVAGKPILLGEEELGAEASEATARAARYKFLRTVEDAEIYTAHHLDDVVESIVINLIRGTGWRGLAPMGGEKIRRPLIEKKWRRKDVLKFAAEKEITFREDPTNSSEKFLRNRVRKKVAEIPDEKFFKIVELYERQKKLREEIEKQVRELWPEDGKYERKWFLTLDDAVATEILRAGLFRAGISATRPQILDFLSAIRTYKTGKEFNLPGGKMVKMHKTYFML